jgi:hypothetical protein
MSGKISDNDRKMNSLANQASHYLRKSSMRSTEGSQYSIPSSRVNEDAAPSVSQSVTALPTRSGSAARASSASRRMPEVAQS